MMDESETVSPPSKNERFFTFMNCIFWWEGVGFGAWVSYYGPYEFFGGGGGGGR